MLKRLVCVLASMIGVSLVAVTVASISPATDDPASSADVNRAMSEAAVEFLNTLSPELRAKAVLPLDDPNRLDWHYVPRERKGVALADLTADQRRAARRLLRTCLSDVGYLKVETILELEVVLREEAEARGQRAPHRDPDLYYFTIFGKPNAASPWGWRVEGHHVSLNFSAVTQTLTTVTPAFMGANPAEVRSGRRAGWRVLEAEEDLGRALLEVLDDEQRAKAIISDRAPRDIILSPGNNADRLGEVQGLPFAALTGEQRSVAMNLLDVYLANFEDDLEHALLNRMIDAGLDNIHFAWAGGTERGEGHYYRLQGPTFVIEYDNIQNNANHIHSVFRDLEHDFGGDTLLAHYREHHSE